jgi:hypothetical protein
MKKRKVGQENLDRSCQKKEKAAQENRFSAQPFDF